jgi:predicted phage terminase large subunit-like protein
LCCGIQDAYNYVNLGSVSLYPSECRIRVEGLTHELRLNELIYNKHIPVEYLTASLEQRKQLFYGLMDADGFCDTRGRCEYTSINKRLAEDVCILSRTLGYKTSILEGDATLNGRIISKKYRVCFSTNKGEKVFTLQRRQDRVDNKPTKDREDKKRHFIKSVMECGRYSVKCITVEGGVYLVGKNLIPTHNSRCITETLPSYFLGKNPYKHVIEVSYNEDFAERFGRRNIEKINEFGYIFNEYEGIGKQAKLKFKFEIAKNKAAATEFEIEKTKGGMLSKGFGSGISGSPSDLTIIDDPYKNRQDADSPAYCNFIIQEWLNVIRIRASAKCKYVVIHTRWNEGDLIGYLLDYEPDKWFEIRFPLEAEEYEPITGRNIGDSLLPEAGKDNEWLKKFKTSFVNDPTEGGMRAWNALMQQRPSSVEGNLIKRAYWQRYKLTLKMQKGEGFTEMLQSWDCSFKDTSISDLVAGGVMGRIGANCFLVDVDYKRMDIIRTMEGITRFSRKYPKALCKLIEDKANGPAVIQMMKVKTPGMIAVKATKSKEEGVNSVLPLWEAGNVYIPDEIEVSPGVWKKCLWADEVIDQHAAFKPGKKVQKDDLVDMVRQALQRFMYAFVPNDIQQRAVVGFTTSKELEDMGVVPQKVIKLSSRSFEQRNRFRR